MCMYVGEYTCAHTHILLFLYLASIQGPCVGGTPPMPSILVQTSRGQLETTTDHRIDDIVVYPLLSVIGKVKCLMNYVHITLHISYIN